MPLANVAQGNSFFINVRDIITTAGTTLPARALSGPVALNADGTAVATAPSWTITTGSAALGNYVAAGSLVLRDLGKTIVIPGNGATGTLQQDLRLVQLVNTGAMTTLTNGLPANGFVNYNEGVDTLAKNVFYIATKPNATNGVFFASLGF